LRVVGEMTGSDAIMNNTLFLGTYPGLTDIMIMSEISRIDSFLGTFKLRSASTVSE